MTPFSNFNFADSEVDLRGAHELRREQTIAAPRASVFEFFSDPANLELLTPPWLNFRIVEIPDSLHEGALIVYRLRLRGLPIEWRTRIEEWTPGERFVDLQTAGPYKLWHHTHEFEDAPDGGTLIRDIVRYKVPLGPLGEIARRTIVRSDLDKIFSFRVEAIEKRFGS